MSKVTFEVKLSGTETIKVKVPADSGFLLMNFKDSFKKNKPVASSLGRLFKVSGSVAKHNTLRFREWNITLEELAGTTEYQIRIETDYYYNVEKVKVFQTGYSIPVAVPVTT